MHERMNPFLTIQGRFSCPTCCRCNFGHVSLLVHPWPGGWVAPVEFNGNSKAMTDDEQPLGVNGVSSFVHP